MENKLNAYLWGYKNYEAAYHVIRKYKQFYPTGKVTISVDKGGDYESYQNIAKSWNAEIFENPFNIGYPGNHQGHNVGRDCWPKENTILWLENIYNVCLKSDSKYLIVLEEDTFILKPITILDKEFGIAVFEYNTNTIPPVLLNMVEQVNGNTNIPSGKWGKGYGAGGGFIIDCDKWVKSYEYFVPILELNYDMLSAQSKLIGWSDCIAQLLIMCGGYDVVMNTQMVQTWYHERPDLYPNYTHWSNYEIVDYLKDIETIKNL